MRTALEGTGVAFTPARTVVEVVRAALASPRPDLLHAHMTAAELAAVLAALRVRCPVVATLHFGSGRGHSATTRLAYRAIEARLDAELAVSRFVADQTGGDVRVLPPGIPEPPLPLEGSPLATPGEARPFVVVAQRLEPEKDTDVALRAWVASGLADRGWELRVAGEGALGPQLRELARQLDPSGSISFVGHRAHLGDDLRAASILLAPTPAEAFGLTVVEAMSLGVPVVAAGGGGHLETVGPTGHDLLFTPGDATGAAARLARLGDDAAERVQVGRDLRARFESDYRIERHTERLQEIYEEVAAPRPRRTSPARHGATTDTPRRDRPSVAFVFPGCHRGGGVERVVRELARCTATTFDVTFVGDRFDPDGMDGVGFLAVGGRRLPGVPRPVSFRRRASKALARATFDVTVGFGVECPPVDIAVVGSVHRVWLRRSGPVHTPFGDVPAGLRYAMPRHLALLALEHRYFTSERLRTVLAASPGTAIEVTDTYGLGSVRVEVMPNGFDPAEFDVGARDRNRRDLRRRLGLTDEVVLLFVANELHRKGFSTLLDAVARLDDPRVRVEMVGRADPSAYHARILELGLAGRVRWNGPRADVAPWYAAADLLVLPTRYEPFGNVIVEALACGLPVVTTAIAGASSAVVPDVNGALQQDPEDADELARILEWALDGDRLECWTRGASTGVERFEWGEVAGVLASAIDRVTGVTPDR